MVREIIVNASPEEHRVVVLEGGRAAEILVERIDESVLGNIYLGRVDKVVPGMQAAFVDIGLARHAFLHASEVVNSRGEKADKQRGIEELLEVDQTVTVQVTREPIGRKGARVTTHLTLPGRYLVHVPEDRHVGISRRIGDEKARDALRRTMRELLSDLPGGCIVRTAALGQEADTLRSELEELAGTWEQVARRREEGAPPELLHAETSLPMRVVRDMLSPDLKRIVVDEMDTWQRVRSFVERRAQEPRPDVRRYQGSCGIFESFGLEAEIDKALRARVWLRSGGYIVINQMEALVAIDVNTGKFTTGRGFEETVLKTNLEAAREVARQLRLRDLGGIVVVDFIDMQSEDDRHRVLDELSSALAADRAKTTVLGMSEFCLVQVTRQRQRRSLERGLSQPCPYCSGTGRIRSVETTVNQILRRLRDLGPEKLIRTVRVHSHPEVATLLRARIEALRSGGQDLGVELDLREEPDRHREAFELLS